MSGKITRAGSIELIQEETTRTPNLISVKTSVRGEGTYRCTIRNNKSGKQVEAVSRVENVGCDSGWTEYSGDFYAYINQKKTWNNAELYCISKGDHLASIKSKQENDFVYRLTTGGRNDYWIGMSDKQVEGSFTWSDGKTATYKNFASGQPNNAANQDCVSFYKNYADYAGKWNDWECSKSFTFVCKIAQ
ncbi:alpha-N-acetylgalactosamine-specific lectin-like [Clytia hemisphaerica]|uniref:C-type lectin domain-containing protein n=1 Tax=Clytia hemisphaerica TaxID=252671 RepID=A0A7M5VAE0_9CNID